MRTDKSKCTKEKNHHKRKKNKGRSDCKKHEIKGKPKKRDKKEKHCDAGFDVPIPKDLHTCTSSGDKSMAPMTKEEWDKRQSIVRKVYDETTGRHRLIKGDGEVLEEIVSHVRHKEINKQATKGDGDYFQQYTVRHNIK